MDQKEGVGKGHGALVAKRRKAIPTWLGKHAPKVLAFFNPPSSSGAITAAEKALGRNRPADYRSFWESTTASGSTPP